MPGLLYENKCSYLMGTQIISCEGSIGSMKEVTDLIDDATSVVLIKGGAKLIITKSCHKYDKCKHITSYQISRINDLEIESDGFGGLENLLYLKVSDNMLDHLEDRVFSGLEKLQKLDMQNCSLNSISDTSFRGLKNLESLDLTSNYLESISSRVFRDLSSLTSLCLHNNQIEKLDLNAFSNLRNLRDLDLTRNKLRHIDSRTFNKVPKLSYLYLSYNEIADITGDLECPNLKFFYIRQNKLKEISETLLKPCSNLVDIDLSCNKIEKANPRAFSNLNSLMSLNIRNNTDIKPENLVFTGQRPLITI